MTGYKIIQHWLQNNTTPRETPQSNQTRYSFGNYKIISRKLYRSRKHRTFLENCLNANVFPKFTTPSISASKYFKPQEITKAAFRNLKKELEAQNEKIKSLSSELTVIYNYLLSTYPFPEISKNIKNINLSIRKQESRNDQNRIKKFHNLKGSINKTVKLEVHNFTNLTIPDEILVILEKGLHNPTGGSPNIHNILIEFEALFQKLEKFADQKNLTFIKKHEMRARIYLCFTELTKCSSKNNDTKIITDFLNENKDILILPLDKNKGSAIMTRSDYLTKLDETFKSEKFLKLKKSPL